MLLKTLSTPVLGSLLPFKEIEPELENDRSLFSCLNSFPNSQSSVNCNFSHESLKRNVVREIALLPRIRRAKSENDLHLLDIKCMSSAKGAVNGFCSSDGNGVVRERTGQSEIASCPQKQSLKLTSLRKHSSVSTISGHFGSGSEMKRPLQYDFLNRITDTNHAVEHLESEATLISDFSDTEHDGSLAVMKKSGAKITQISMDRRTWDADFHSQKKESKSKSISHHSSVWQAKVVSEETAADSRSQRHSEPASFSGKNDQDYCNMRFSKRYTSEAAKGVAVSFNSSAEVSKKLGLGIGLAGDGNGDGGYGDYIGRRFDNDSGGNPEEFYQRMLKANPNHPLLLRNYARFLFEVVKDHTRAEEFFERAVLATTGDGEVLAQYANLIWQHYGDADRAAIYYEQAVQAAPNDPYVLAANASFVWASEKNEEEANNHLSASCLSSDRQLLLQLEADGTNQRALYRSSCLIQEEDMLQSICYNEDFNVVLMEFFSQSC